MSIAFNPHRRLVLVEADVTGPLGSRVLSLALDTGASYTLLNEARLVSLGYDPAQATSRIPVVTASGAAACPQIILSEIRTLGQARLNFPVLCHPLPAGATFDGLLGLDFLRGQILTIDFRAGQITLT